MTTTCTRMVRTIGIPILFLGGSALLPSILSAQNCEDCDNGVLQDQVAHQFGLPLGELFECGELGQYECHEHPVVGKCSDQHCFCGGNCQTLVDDLEEATRLESPALFQKALAEGSESIRLDGIARSLAVIDCNGAVISAMDLPVWASDTVLTGLHWTINEMDTMPLH